MWYKDINSSRRNFKPREWGHWWHGLLFCPAWWYLCCKTIHSSFLYGILPFWHNIRPSINKEEVIFKVEKCPLWQMLLKYLYLSHPVIHGLRLFTNNLSFVTGVDRQQRSHKDLNCNKKVTGFRIRKKKSTQWLCKHCNDLLMEVVKSSSVKCFQ